MQTQQPRLTVKGANELLQTVFSGMSPLVVEGRGRRGGVGRAGQVAGVEPRVWSMARRTDVPGGGRGSAPVTAPSRRSARCRVQAAAGRRDGDPWCDFGERGRPLARGPEASRGAAVRWPSRLVGGGRGGPWPGVPVQHRRPALVFLTPLPKAVEGWTEAGSVGACGGQTAPVRKGDAPDPLRQPLPQVNAVAGRYRT